MFGNSQKRQIFHLKLMLCVVLVLQKARVLLWNRFFPSINELEIYTRDE